MAAERLTIDELAARTGLTARNIRYYQSRGLLPPPTVTGRQGHYDERHVERLGLIHELQAEGLNLQSIGWLLSGAGGVDTAELRRLKRAVLDEWVTDDPVDLPVATVLTGFDVADETGSQARRAARLGLLAAAQEPGEVRVRLPAVLAAGRELVEMGASVDDLLDVLELMREHAQAIAAAYVEVFDEAVLADWEERGRPEAERPVIREAVDRLRPLAGEALLAVFRQAMAEAVTARLRAEPGTDPGAEPGTDPGSEPGADPDTAGS